ncbi:MAG: hypothetical protein AAB091_04310 [Elusimicrobiota bacterium]
MKQKIIGFFVTIKRLVLIGICLLGMTLLFRLMGLRSRAASYAVATAGMLELRLAGVQEHLEVSARRLDGRKDSGVSAARFLAGFLAFSPVVEEISWVHGDGRSSVAYVRTPDGIAERAPSAKIAAGPLYAAHQKGQIIVLPLEYKPNAIPSFQLSYPLDGREGGFVLARVNLWDFLKPPTTLAEGLLGPGFDLEVKDREGRLLAHKTTSDPWKKVFTRFFSARSTVKSLGFNVEVAANRVAFMDAVRPGRSWWACLALSVAMAVLL